MDLENDQRTVVPTALAAIAARRLGITDPENAPDSDLEALAGFLDPGTDGSRADAGMVNRWLAGEAPDAIFIPSLAKLAGVDIAAVEIPNPHPYDPPTLDERLTALIMIGGKIDDKKTSAIAADIAQRANVGSLDPEAVVRWAKGGTPLARFFPPLLKACETTLAEVNFARAKRLARQKLQETDPNAQLVESVERCRNASEWVAIAGTVYPTFLRGIDLPRIAQRIHGAELNDRAASSAASNGLFQDGQTPGPDMLRGAILAINAYLSDPDAALAACAWNDEGKLDPPSKALFAKLQGLMRTRPEFSPDKLEAAIAATGKINRSTLSEMFRDDARAPVPATLAKVLEAHPPLCVALLGKMPDGSMPKAKIEEARKSGPATPPPPAARPSGKPSGKKPAASGKVDLRSPFAPLREAWLRLIPKDRKAYGPGPALARRTGISAVVLTSLEQGYTSLTEAPARMLVNGIPELWPHLPADLKERIPDPRPKPEAPPAPPPAEPPAAAIPTDAGAEGPAAEAIPPEPPPEDAPAPIAAKAPPPDEMPDAPTPEAPATEAETSAPPPPAEAAPIDTPSPEAVPGHRIAIADATSDATPEDDGRTIPAPPPSAKTAPPEAPDTTPPTRTIPAAAEPEPPKAPAAATEVPAEPQRMHPEDLQRLVEEIRATKGPNADEIAAALLLLLRAKDEKEPTEPVLGGQPTLHETVISILVTATHLGHGLVRGGVDPDERVKSKATRAAAELIRLYRLDLAEVIGCVEGRPISLNDVKRAAAQRP